LSKSQALLTKQETEITEEEIAFYEKYLFLGDIDKIKPFLQEMSMFWRSLDGLPIEPEDVFSGMLNIKDIRERTRYPTILDLKKHVTLRLIEKTYPVFGAFGKWADEEEHHFISYPKGEGRKEGVEIMKAKGMIAQGIAPIFLGELGQTKPQGKRRFWQRKPKQAESEFENQ